MQAALAAATRGVVSAADGVPTPAEKFHFTLAFLGSVPESRIAELSPIAASVASAFRSVAGSAPITVTLDRIDHWRKPEILCATSTREPAEAIALAGTLRNQLTANGFAPDLKPFRAHATLARKVRRVSRERNMAPVLWTFPDFHLVESRTESTGAVYSSREIWPLYAEPR